MSKQQATTAIPVDLVVVIDTSVSMRDEAQALSEAAQAAIEAAKSSCPSDLRVAWLGIEGTWKGTRFNRTLRGYLTKQCGIAESDLRGRKRGELAGGGAQEDAARAIEDIATYFDWRPAATRAVFYLGDEALEGGGDKTEQKDIEAANRAIKTAQEAGVTVHTYFGTSKSKFRDTVLGEYARVAHETGGQAFTYQDAIQGFREVLEKIICGSRNPSLYQQTLDRCPVSKREIKEEETTPPELLTPQRTADKTLFTLAESGKLAGKHQIHQMQPKRNNSMTESERSAPAPSDMSHVITNGVKLAGDTVLAPGTSLLLEGRVIEGSLYVIVGFTARALMGPVGWLAVAASSYASATTGKNLLQLATEALREVRSSVTPTKDEALQAENAALRAEMAELRRR
jgi:hypothetical protein